MTSILPLSYILTLRICFEALYSQNQLDKWKCHVYKIKNDTGRVPYSCYSRIVLDNF